MKRIHFRVEPRNKLASPTDSIKLLLLSMVWVQTESSADLGVLFDCSFSVELAKPGKLTQLYVALAFSDRDVFNEKPSREEIMAATQVKFLFLVKVCCLLLLFFFLGGGVMIINLYAVHVIIYSTSGGVQYEPCISSMQMRMCSRSKAQHQSISGSAAETGLVIRRRRHIISTNAYMQCRKLDL